MIFVDGVRIARCPTLQHAVLPHQERCTCFDQLSSSIDAHVICCHFMNFRKTSEDNGLILNVIIPIGILLVLPCFVRSFNRSWCGLPAAQSLRELLLQKF
jgi:hypothetical protein